jgi:hypothetical protein
MPRRPRTRRNRIRRTSPPLPGPLHSESGLSPHTRGAMSGQAETSGDRPTPYIASELRRIGLVSTVCFGLLLLLVLVDRLA